MHENESIVYLLLSSNSAFQRDTLQETKALVLAHMSLKSLRKLYFPMMLCIAGKLSRNREFTMSSSPIASLMASSTIVYDRPH